MQHLLRERTHISNSLSTSAAVINQASEIHVNLQQQGNSLRNNVQAVVGRILSSIPQANTLIQNIRRRRNRDDMILAGVIASCVLFTLYYLFG
uniref:Golgi SNAP receptor complex member 1 n=1 Tax=Grammatophora oceanica TaxID=210454 RepID=A0A7S1UZ61_9STRA